MGLNRTWHITIVWQEIMKSIPMKPDVIMQKSSLGACKIHRNFDLGKKAGLEVIELAPDDHASYVLLFTLYATSNCPCPRALRKKNLFLSILMILHRRRIYKNKK